MAPLHPSACHELARGEGGVERCERAKASVRAKVEHPFLYLKRRFGYAKVRYRGLAKNRQRIALPPGFANLMIGERHLALA